MSLSSGWRRRRVALRQGAEGVCKGGIGKTDQGIFAGGGGKEEWRPRGEKGTVKRLTRPGGVAESGAKSELGGQEVALGPRMVGSYSWRCCSFW